MIMRVSQLQCREVICVSSGQRLGFVSDLEVTVPEGNITSLLVPGQCKGLGLMGAKEEYRIPWCCIKRIGPDIILVDADPNQCRIPKNKPKLPFSAV